MKRRKKPEFSDSVVWTLMWVHDFILFPNETQYIEFILANQLAL